jgi:hypothetical protein
MFLWSILYKTGPKTVSQLSNTPGQAPLTPGAPSQEAYPMLAHPHIATSSTE